MACRAVDVRTNPETGWSRLRFYAVAPDQLESILDALRLARVEHETEFDSVALEAICLSYLNTPTS